MTLGFSNSNKFNPDAPKANTFTFRTFGRSSAKLSAIKARGGIKLAIKTDGEVLESTIFDPPTPSTSTAPTSFSTPLPTTNAAPFPSFEPIIPANSNSSTANDIPVSPSTTSKRMRLQVTPPTPPRGATAGRRASDIIPVGPCAEWGGRRVFPKVPAGMKEEKRSQDEEKVEKEAEDGRYLEREENDEARKKRLEALFHALDDLEAISLDGSIPELPVIPSPSIPASDFDAHELPSCTSHPMSRTYAASSHPLSPVFASPPLSGTDSPMHLSHSIESSPALSATSSHDSSDNESPSSSAFPSPDLNNHSSHHLRLRQHQQYNSPSSIAISIGEDGHDEGEAAAYSSGGQEDWQARWAGIGRKGGVSGGGGLGLGFLTDACRAASTREEGEQYKKSVEQVKAKTTMTVGRASGKKVEEISWI